MRALALTLLLLLASPAAADDAWHVVKANGFTVEMPLPPNAEEQKVDLGGGKTATMRTWQARQMVTPGAIYDVTVAEYPKSSFDAAKIEEHLDGARNGAVANAAGPLLGETRIEFAGHPARELLIDMTMGYNSRTVVFIDGDRLFSLGAITRKDNERSPAIERYFASFKLIRP